MGLNKNGSIDQRTLQRHRTRYHSPYDGPPPRYIGPVWIGKPAARQSYKTYEDIVLCPGDWIGERLPYTRSYGGRRDKPSQII